MPVRAVHQLIPTAAPSDAVTQQAFAWRDAVRRHGLDGDVFAEQSHPSLRREARPLTQLRGEPDEAVILHYSIWSRAAERAMKIDPARLGINYQNITPGSFLEAVNPEVAALCDQGRAELTHLAQRARLLVAPSQFNAGDLREVGRTDISIVPLILPVAEPPPASVTVPPVIVTVGRIVPNKRLEDAIRAVALLRQSTLPDARLEIVGSADGFDRYGKSLEAFASRLRVLDAVRFRGRVSDDERDAFYRDAGAYLCMSEHEGFCAPLIEALTAGLPVVARSSGAIPETLGDAALFLPDGEPALAAEALATVLTRHDLRVALQGRGAQRLRELAPARVEEALITALGPLLDE